MLQKKLTQHNSTQNECWKNKWKIMKGQIAIPKSSVLLSVTYLGANLSGYIASKLVWYIQVFLESWLNVSHCHIMGQGWPHYPKEISLTKGITTIIDIPIHKRGLPIFLIVHMVWIPMSVLYGLCEEILPLHAYCSPSFPQKRACYRHGSYENQLEGYVSCQVFLQL